MELKNVPTEELVKELGNREEVKTFCSKLYQGYNIEIVKKFSEDRTPEPIPANAIILVIGD